MERIWVCNVLLRKIFSTVLLGLCKEETSVCRDVGEHLNNGLVKGNIYGNLENGPTKLSKESGVVIKQELKIGVGMIKRLLKSTTTLFVVKILLFRRVVD